MQIARLASVAVVTMFSAGLLHAADDLDTFIQAQMPQRQINGLSLAVIENGKIESRAYGVTSRGGVAVTTTTLFQAGSISKPVSAIGALKLVERGRLSLDEDVNRKLKSWKVPENEFTTVEKVTLRRLLSHTGGLTVSGFPGYDVTERRPSVTEVLDGKGNTLPVRVDVIPGTVWRYAGGGYTVMQQMVADVTGMPFSEYMREAVLEPLGMANSTFEQPLPPNRVGETASGYYQNRSAVSGKWHVYPEMAAAGLWTTPTDLARFAIEVQQSLAGKSNKIISQAMARQQLTSQMNDFGLGLFLGSSGNERNFNHGGRDEGFDARLLALSGSSHGLIVMINANDNSRMMNRITAFVANKYDWPARASTAPAAIQPVSRTIPFGPVTGFYGLGDNLLTLVAQGDSLFTEVNGLPDEQFLFMGDDRFGSKERNVSFQPARSSTGAIVGLTWIVNGKQQRAPRIGPLLDSITPLADPDPSATRSVVASIRGLLEGNSAVPNLKQLTSGARSDFAESRPMFAGFRRITYVSSENVADRQIERHGSIVSKVVFYQMETERGRSWLLVHLTGDHLIAHCDVVND